MFQAINGIHPQGPPPQFIAQLISAGIPANIAQQSPQAVKAYADKNGITLPDPPKRPEPRKDIFQMQRKHPAPPQGGPQEFMAKLIAAGIPFGIVLQGKEAVESYAKKHDITLPDPPKKPPIGQFNQVA